MVRTGQAPCLLQTTASSPRQLNRHDRAPGGSTTLMRTSRYRCSDAPDPGIPFVRGAQYDRARANRRKLGESRLIPRIPTSTTPSRRPQWRSCRIGHGPSFAYWPGCIFRTRSRSSSAGACSFFWRVRSLLGRPSRVFASIPICATTIRRPNRPRLRRSTIYLPCSRPPEGRLPSESEKGQGPHGLTRTDGFRAGLDFRTWRPSHGAAADPAPAATATFSVHANFRSRGTESSGRPCLG